MMYCMWRLEVGMFGVCVCICCYVPHTEPYGSAFTKTAYEVLFSCGVNCDSVTEWKTRAAGWTDGSEWGDFQAHRRNVKREPTHFPTKQQTYLARIAPTNVAHYFTLLLCASYMLCMFIDSCATSV